MKGRAQLALLTANQADAEALRNDLQQWLDARGDRTSFEAQDPTVMSQRGGTAWAVVGNIGFETRQGVDALLARIESRWSTGPLSTRVLSGSSVSLHDCSHDAADGFCAVNAVSVKP